MGELFCGINRSTKGQSQPHKRISNLNLMLPANLLTKSRPEATPKVQGWEVHVTSPFTMRSGGDAG